MWSWPWSTTRFVAMIARVVVAMKARMALEARVAMKLVKARVAVVVPTNI